MSAPRKVVEGLRAIGVMAGGPLVVLIAALAAVRSIVRAIIRGRAPSLPAALGLTAVLLYAGPVRRWMRSWGARPGEGTATGPVHAIEVEAPREAVWPWLAQIGQDRGGFYSYEWLENLAGCRMRNAERIHPEWQHREVGDKVMLHPLNGLPVSRFEPGREIALEGWGSFASSRSMRPAAGWCVAASPARASPSPSTTRSVELAPVPDGAPDAARHQGAGGTGRGWADTAIRLIGGASSNKGDERASVKPTPPRCALAHPARNSSGISSLMPRGDRKRYRR